MGMPSTKAACLERIKHHQSNIAAATANMSGNNVPKSLKEMCRGQIAQSRAEIAKLRTHMKTLKK